MHISNNDIEQNASSELEEFDNQGNIDANDNVEKYTRWETYKDRVNLRKIKMRTKTLYILIASFFAVILVSGVAMWGIMSADHVGVANAEDTQKVKTFAASEDDIAKLAEQGYDAEKLTETAEKFVTKFLTVDGNSVNDGSWYDSYESMVNYDIANDLTTENMVVLRTTDTWKKMFENHPYYATEFESCESIKWDITYYEDEPLPYCDITVKLIRPELDFYTVNSIALQFSEYLDTYRITFSSKGKVIKIKRVSAMVLDENIDAATTLLDGEAAEAYLAQLIKNGNANTIKGIEDEEAKQAAEDAERQKALEEAERAKKEAEEEAAKRNEENKNANNNDNSNANTGTNTNTNTGGNTNAGGNTGGNANTTPGSGTNTGSNNGNETAGGSAATQPVAPTSE